MHTLRIYEVAFDGSSRPDSLPVWQTEVTVQEQAARIKELEDLLRQLRAELNSGGSSMTAVASAVTFISAASAVDEVFSRQWSNKSREEPAISVSNLNEPCCRAGVLRESDEACCRAADADRCSRCLSL